MTISGGSLTQLIPAPKRRSGCVLIDRTGEKSAAPGPDGKHCCQIYVLGPEAPATDIEDLDSPNEPELDEDATRELEVCGKPAELYLVRSNPPGGQAQAPARTLQFLCDEHALKFLEFGKATEVIKVNDLAEAA